jgi:hypothetical protein
MRKRCEPIYEALRDLTGAKFYGAVPIFDRYETPAEYEALSR